MATILAKLLFYPTVMRALFTDWREMFRVDYELVWYLRLSLLMRVSTLFFPLTLVAQPIAGYVIFKFFLLKLDYVSQTEGGSIDESTAVYINLMNIITYAINMVVIIAYTI